MLIQSATHGYLRASVEDLESHLLASRRIRDFLKCFSATQWPRVVKATLLLGIQALEKRQNPTHLSVADIEDFVVSNEALMAVPVQVKKEQPKKENTKKKAYAKVAASVQVQAAVQTTPVQRVFEEPKQILEAQSQIPTQDDLTVQNVITTPVIKQTQPNYHYQNPSRPLSETSQRKPEQNRRRDKQQSHHKIFFDSQRSSSVPAVSAEPSARFQQNQQKKPPASWRTPAISNFQRNGQRPGNRIFNEEILSADGKRARSLSFSQKYRSIVTCLIQIESFDLP